MKNKKYKTLILSDDLEKEAKKIAEKKEISLNCLIRIALSEYIERNK